MGTFTFKNPIDATSITQNGFNVPTKSSIEPTGSLPTATASSPDIINYLSETYSKITKFDLYNTSWALKANFTITDNMRGQYLLPIVYNGVDYVKIGIGYEGDTLTSYTVTLYKANNSTLVIRSTSSEDPRWLAFYTGIDSSNRNLVKWINSNCTLKSGSQEKYTYERLSHIEDIQSGAFTSIEYDKINKYRLVILYGYKDALPSPNQTAFVFMPDKLTRPKYVNGILTDQEDFIVSAIGGNSNSSWNYSIKLKIGQFKPSGASGYTVYWWTMPDYSGSTDFVATKMIGIK